jgi:hypothetical protein
MESGPPDHARPGSSLRHWPPGTNSKKFVPSFFVFETVAGLSRSIRDRLLKPHHSIPFGFRAGLK